MAFSHRHCDTRVITIPNDQPRIDEINAEIETITMGKQVNVLIDAAQTEIKRLEAAAKPFRVEVQVRQEQRSAQFEAEQLESSRLAEIANNEGGVNKEHALLAGGAVVVASVVF